MNRLSFLELLSSIADRGRELLDLPGLGAAERPLQELCTELMSRTGEATGTALAREILRGWQALDAEGRVEFFEMLARDFAPDREAVSAVARRWLQDGEEDALAEMWRIAEPPRQELFRRINRAPGGTRALVDMRAALLEAMRERPHLAPVDKDMAHLLSSWFNRGFLELRRIDWNTPAAVLEKLIAYEAVHEIKGWDDLRRRLARDRGCFAFFHPAMPDEPLIFVEVALVEGIAGNVHALLSAEIDEDARKTADTAVFYSISNCQAGLRGISFGSFLIKQVVEELRREAPSLRHFVTLSPVPGFRAWLRREGEADPDCAALHERTDDPAWVNDAEAAKELRAPLMRHCARYLLQARRKNLPADPVARFHLGNGARLERLNWMADTSPKGLRQSAGIMVNYAYRLGDIERNHEAFVREGRVAAARAVTQLQRQG